MPSWGEYNTGNPRHATRTGRQAGKHSALRGQRLSIQRALTDKQVGQVPGGITLALQAALRDQMPYSLYRHGIAQCRLHLFNAQVKIASASSRTVLHQKMCRPQGHEAANVNELHQVRLTVFA